MKKIIADWRVIAVFHVRYFVMLAAVLLCRIIAFPFRMLDRAIDAVVGAVIRNRRWGIYSALHKVRKVIWFFTGLFNRVDNWYSDYSVKYGIWRISTGRWMAHPNCQRQSLVN